MNRPMNSYMNKFQLKVFVQTYNFIMCTISSLNLPKNENLNCAFIIFFFY